MWILSKKQAQILTAFQLNADKPITAAAKSLKMREHTVRYALSELLEKQIIKPAVVVNCAPLGFRSYTLHFSCNLEGKQAQERLFKVSESLEGTLSFGVFSGGFSFITRYLVHKDCEPNQYMRALTAKIELNLGERVCSVETYKEYYPSSHLVSTKSRQKNDFMILNNTLGNVELDKLDHDILALKQKSPASSNRALAKELGVSHTSLEYRVHTLEKKGILQGTLYLINWQQLGIQRYRFLIQLKSQTREIIEAIRNYSRHHPNILQFNETVGVWDISLLVEVIDGSLIVDINQDIFDKFGKDIYSTRVLTELKGSGYNSYPFRNLPHQSA